MTLRRTCHALLGAATALSTALVGAAVVPAAASAAEPSCGVMVVGVQPNGKLVERTFVAGVEIESKTTDRGLPFRPTNFGSAGGETIRGGVRYFHVATTRDGRPRVVVVTDRDRRDTLSFEVERSATTDFTPRLFASTGHGPEMLALEGGALVQYRADWNANDRLVLARVGVARRGLGDLRTLSGTERRGIDGVQHDIFLATTKGGALKQVRVPVRRPEKTTVRLVAKTGFGAFTGLSLGGCRNRSNTMFVGINATANKARWFTLRDFLKPRPANLTDHGALAPGSNWRLRPTM